ncbi:hypothetical protein P879_05088, partial [Paragonimus westermani]
DLDQLEYYCEKLYTTDDPVVRTQAEKACASLCDRRDCPSICQLLLQRSTSCYAQLIASTALTKYISNRDTVIPLTTRIEIRDYVLNFLASHSDLEKFVQQALVTLVCRLTKTGWFDCLENNEGFRDILTCASKFIESGQSSAVLIGVQLLNNLVSEMNQNAESDMTRIIFLQRKLSASFRDCLLLPIFRLSLNLLREADKNIQSLDFTNVNQHGLVSQSLQLFHACLTFDFIGTTAGTGSFLGDDSSNGLDDLVVIQIPTSWRSIFLDTDTVPLFFRLYRGLPPELSTLVLSCLVQLASVRRSLFTNPERTIFLSGLVNGARNILATQSSTLADQNIYHEFCRLLSRLKCNFQLTELAALDCYVEFIQLLTAFTIHTLKSFHKETNHNNSLHYLLALWQRLVASVPYVQSPDSDLMEDAASQISRAYIEACVASVTDYVNCPTRVRVTSAKQRTSHPSRNLWPFASSEDTKATAPVDGSSENDDDVECPLDDMTTLLQQLEQFAIIGRCKYAKTCALLIQLFDEAAGSYEKALTMVTQGSSVDSNLLQVIRLDEHRLAWLVYMVGSLIGSRVNYTNSDDDCDGELVCRVLQLVYQRLSEVLGISDDLTVLGVFANKIVTNIKYWSSNEPILNRTLNLLSELSRGYTAIRKLIRLDDIQFVLTNHNEEHFPFLATKAGTSSLSPARQAAEFRLRTSFYASLARLLMVDLGENEDRFLKFMAPLTRSTNRLIIAVLSGGPSHMSPEEIKGAIVGLARDLRGLSSSLNTKSSYQMLLDWFYPMGFKLFGRALELWPLDPTVNVSVLKLLTEIVHNRNGRLLFDPTVPTGYLLFTELSRVLTAFGLQLIPNTRDLPKQSVYQVKLKPIVAALDALKVCLSGSFINFGVFSLFREESLEKAVEMGVQLMLCVDESELQEFPKVAHSFFSLLEYLVNDHMPFVASLGGVLIHFLNTIANNILSTDTTIAENCCLCLDYILTHVFKLVQHEQHSNLLSDGPQISADESLRLITLEDDSSVSNGNTAASKKYGASRYAVWSTRTPVAEANLLDLIKLSSDGLGVPASLNLLRRILVILLSSVIQEDCRIQWSMTRPLLPLILLNNEYYLELRNRVIANLPVGRQQAMTKLFDKLMDEVEFNLTGKNRDKFTQNVSSFKLALGEFVKSMYSKSSDDMDSSSTAGAEAIRNGGADQCASECLCLSTAIIQTAGLGLVL